jgi:beta-lactamase class A
MKKAVTLYTGFVLFLVGGLSFLLLYRLKAMSNAVSAKSVSTTEDSKIPCDVTTYRLGGYDLVKPLLYVEKKCESTNLLSVKEAASARIRDFKTSGDITDAAVYIRDLERGEWTGIHENVAFHPGSFFKIPILLAYLHKAQSDPGLLDREYLFEAPANLVLPKQNYLASGIVSGNKYTVRQLLHYAIVDSDNYAHWLLHQKIPYAEFDKVFQDLNLVVPIPDPRDSLLRISPRDFSVFFRTLYNASYLSPEMSVYALSMLTETKFKEGMMKGLPEGARVAHKFGEFDNGVDFELHESGIVYIKGKAFLITVMTLGRSREKLPNVVASLTRSIYDTMVAP